MTLAPHPSLSKHAVLEGVTWEDYEHILAEIDNGNTRVTFLDGRMEIMSPLPEHERPSRSIGRLLEDVTLELGLPIASFGSSTFRRDDRRAGLEPDECFYIQNEAKVRNMKRFNPRRHPPPDLAVEVDITHRSIPREPVYARLGVPEIWRYDGKRLVVRVLAHHGSYGDNSISLALPFLPLDRFTQFVHRMFAEEQNAVVRDFRKWVRANKRKWHGSKA